MSDPRFDVAVVGAGPAGACTAAALACAGQRTVLVDRAVFPRYKTCGGGLVARAARLMAIDLDAVVEADCREAELVDQPPGRRFLLHRPTPLVRMTMRERLDTALARVAVESGAVLRDGLAVRGLDQGPNEVRLRTAAGSLRAGWVVGADGAAGVVARAAGWGELPWSAPAIEWELEVSGEAMDRFAGRARFDLGFPEGGYGWVFPKREHLSVGIGLLARRADRRRGLRALLDEYVARLGLEPRGDRGRHGFLIPVRPRREGFARGRVLLVGDAAGLADPLTGEGITHAVRSGRLAAEALSGAAGAAGDPRAVACRYTRALEGEILAELRAARRLAQLVYAFPAVRHRLFARHGQALAEAMGQLVAGERGYRETLRAPRNWLRLVSGGRSGRR